VSDTWVEQLDKAGGSDKLNKLVGIKRNNQPKLTVTKIMSVSAPVSARYLVTKYCSTKQYYLSYKTIPRYVYQVHSFTLLKLINTI
jgi:hypothetical protein